MSSIDEQLAEETAKFEARLAAEAQPKKAAPAGKFRPNPKSKKVGEVAHTHVRTHDDEIYDKPCLYIEHYVNDARGFQINEQRYQGRVLVPQCVADYLSMMESKAHASERALFQDRGSRIHYGEVKG